MILIAIAIPIALVATFLRSTEEFYPQHVLATSPDPLQTNHVYSKII